MKTSFWESLEDLMTGRAYLPIYALASERENGAPVIPPIMFWKPFE